MCERESCWRAEPPPVTGVRPPSRPKRRFLHSFLSPGFPKLDILNAAISLNDLKSPGNRLEKLKNDLEGFWSIRVNDRYRIVFRFKGGNAAEVRCQDHP